MTHSACSLNRARRVPYTDRWELRKSRMAAGDRRKQMGFDFFRKIWVENCWLFSFWRLKMGSGSQRAWANARWKSQTSNCLSNQRARLLISETVKPQRWCIERCEQRITSGIESFLCSTIIWKQQFFCSSAFGNGCNYLTRTRFDDDPIEHHWTNSFASRAYSMIYFAGLDRQPFTK